MYSFIFGIFLASYYGKVTLFEGRKVVKAKKTRPISAFLQRTAHVLESSTKPSLPDTLTESRTETSDEKLFKNINQNPEFEVIQESYFIIEIYHDIIDIFLQK